MMEDIIIYNSNAVYHVCRGDAKQQHENDRNRETVPIEDSDEAVHTAFTTAYEQLLNDNKIVESNVAFMKMKKLLIVIILLVAVLAVTTLTAMIFSLLSYRLCQVNDNSTKLEQIQKNLVNLQTQLYCGAGEWHRIALLNMTDPSQQCPPAWREYNTSGIRACGRASSNEGSCSSVAYNTMAKSVYSRVCGQVISYQVGSPDAFRRQPQNPNNIDMDGINITLGTRHRQHIWSLVAGITENSSFHGESNCPCSFTSGTASPSHISYNYYCESGNPTDDYMDNQIFNNDPLWDGQQCEGTCCTGTNSPPWFSVRLPAPTTDMIEVSICGDESTDNEDNPIELLEIYVQYS